MRYVLISTTAIFAAFFLSFYVTTASAQGPAEKGDVATEERYADREKIRQLESQLEAIQHQLDELKAIIGDLTKQTSKVLTVETAASETQPPAVAQPFSQEKRETGIDLGHARLTPYGSIYFNAFSNSGAVNNADVPLFATPTGRGGTGATLRQTRLGVRLDRFKLVGASATAVLETDFFGGFPSVGIGENFGVVRLRLANLKLNWEKTSLTVGQDWSVFAPANPVSLAAAAIPQLAASGNNWARLPQVKLEHKLHSSLLAQFALAAQQTGDSATNAPFFLQPNSGSAGSSPRGRAR